MVNFYTLAKVEGETEVEILSHTDFLTSDGYFRVVGEVKNNENTNITDVTIEIALFDSDGKLIQTYEHNTDLSVLLTGRKTPFNLWITNKTEVALMETYELKVIHYKEFPEGKPEGLEILWHTAGNISIYGEIKSTGFEVANFIAVYAMFYDENERITDTEMDVIGSLDPNDDETFQIPFPSRDIVERATYYSLTAESREFAIKGETELRLLTVSDGNHGYDVFYVFGILVGSSAIGLLIAILVAKRKQKKRLRRQRKTKTNQ